MDVDFDPEQEKKRKFEQSLLDRSRKKKKRKSAFAEALEKSKKLNPGLYLHAFHPTNSSFLKSNKFIIFVYQSINIYWSEIK